MSKKTYNGILKDNTKEQNYIHPQTNSRQVLTGENNNSNLQEELNAINDKFAQLQENETNKGAFRDYNSLIAKYQNSIANPLDRAGWTAIVEDEDKLYFYDTEENQWKPTSSGGGTGSGIQSVNAKTDKNIVLTGSDINSTIDDNNTKTITEHLQDIKNISSDGSIVANQAKEKAQYLEEQIQTLLSNPNSIFTINEKATYTLFNNNTLKNGIYLLKAGADVYYGHEGYSGSSNYKLKLYSGAILIVQRTNDWGSLGGFGSTTFQAIDSSEIYTGITNHYNSSCNKLPMPQKFTNEGFSTQNFIAKIIDANGTMQWIAPDYYTKSQTYTKQQIEELVANVGGTGGGENQITDTLTLSKEVTTEDGVYTSSSSITIGDNDNLQIKEEDIRTIKHLYGTHNNPIILLDLEDGDYILHNFIRPTSIDGATTYAIVYDCVVNNENVYDESALTSLEVSIKKTTLEARPYTYVTIKDFNTLSYVYNLQEKFGVTYAFTTFNTDTKNPNAIFKTRTIKLYANSTSLDSITQANPPYDSFMASYGANVGNFTSYFGLSTVNSKEYVPTGDYHPATKKFVVDNFPLKIVENVDEQLTSNDGAYFYTTSATDDIYVIRYNKQRVQLPKGEIMPADPTVYAIEVDKSILDVKLPDTVNQTATYAIQISPVDKYNYDAGTNYKVYLKVTFENNIVTRVYFAVGPYSTYDKNVYINGVWDDTPVDIYNLRSGITIAKYPNFRIVGITDEADGRYYIQDKLFSVVFENKKDALMLKGENGSSGNVDTSGLGGDINLSLDTTNYVLTAQLVNKDGASIGTPKTVDLPLESVVVNASYNNSTKEITLTLNNGNTTSFSVADLVSGLVPNNRSINGKSLTENVELTGKDIYLGEDGQVGSITTHILTLEEIISNLEENLGIVFEQQFDKIIYVNVSGYDGDENDITFRIPAVVGLVQTYYYDNADYGGEIKVRITGMGENNATITTISKPSGVEIITTGSYVKLKDL